MGYGLEGNRWKDDPGKASDAQSRAWWGDMDRNGMQPLLRRADGILPDAKGTKVIQPQGEVLEY
jgi:hypothetical protein